MARNEELENLIIGKMSEHFASRVLAAQESYLLSGWGTTSCQPQAEEPLTVIKLRDMFDRVRKMPPMPKMTVSAYATALDGLNFPASKNRSARVLKKLLRRYGTQECRSPAAYQIGNDFIVHPLLAREIEMRLSTPD